MSYFYSLVQKENPNIPEDHVKEVLKVLYSSGCISGTLQKNYEIYLFYIEERKKCRENNYPLKVALRDTADHFNISERHIKRIFLFFVSEGTK